MDGKEMGEQLLQAVAKSIKSFRVRNKISQRELSGVSGLNRSYLSDVEMGKVNVSLINLNRIAGALSVSLVEILQDAESENRAIVTTNMTATAESSVYL